MAVGILLYVPFLIPELWDPGLLWSSPERGPGLIVIPSLGDRQEDSLAQDPKSVHIISTTVFGGSDIG